MKKILLLLAVALTLGACSKNNEGAEPEKETPKFEFPAGTCITEYDSAHTYEDNGVCMLITGTQHNFYVSDPRGVQLGGQSKKVKWSVTGPSLTIKSEVIGVDVDVHYENKVYEDGDKDNRLYAEDEKGNKIMLKIGFKH